MCGEPLDGLRVARVLERTGSVRNSSRLARSCMRVQEPVQWMGGTICELFKGSGTVQDMKNYRGILLAD
eukprot:14494952-Alexandrium_andersonii.AAC.1